ncbi:MAG: hypothetical protein IKD91_00075 [Clostridiales bacterium]|nr:hypothetical protein [Clostridiales bacterium]
MEKMNYDEFKKEVEAVIKDYLPDEFKDAKVSVNQVSKIGMTYDSLTVRPEGQVASPAANLNAFFEDYEDGKPFDEVMDSIADVIQMEAPEQMKNMSWLLDYDQAKEHLFIRVSNAETNQDLLDKAPHKVVDDLVITCHIAVDQGPNGMASTIVNNDLLEHFGIDEKQLFADAMEKSPEVMPVKMDTMLNVISGMMPEAVSEDMMMDQDFPGSQMMIVSNTAMVNGAAAIFYPGVMDEISEKLGGDFVMLPSSTNEVIIVPDMGDYKNLESMVKDINSSCVDPKEQLSDHVYHYDAKEKLFERTDKFEARKAEKDKAPAKKSLLSDLKEKKAQVEEMKKTAPVKAQAKKTEQSL